MFILLFTFFNITFIAFLAWLILRYLSNPQVHFIIEYKQVSFLFLIGTAVLVTLYIANILPYFETFSLTPLLLLVFLYGCMFLVYRFMKHYVELSLLNKLETKKVYFASMSNRYLIYKSCDILFQQIAIVCVFTFLKDLHISYQLIVLLFAISFSVSHFFMMKRGLVIGLIFIASALIGGIVFPLLLTLPFGIVYTYILHWLFYILIGVLILYMNKHYPQLTINL